MLIEDDPDIRSIVVLALGLQPEIVVIEVDCGASALDRLRAVPTPDLILIDNSLPDMDGVSLMRLMGEEHPETRSRMVFITASVRDRDVERFKSAGALAIIEKPFDPLQLGVRIRALIGS